ALKAFGGEGFRAVCVLLEAGNSHYRTWELLRDTWQPGEERHLIALASGPALPNYASWAVWEGLGVADTPAVRALLLQHLASAEDAGLFMATAKGLAHLGELAAVKPIVTRLLAARASDGGVVGHLLNSLVQIGGDEVVSGLKQLAGSESQ